MTLNIAKHINQLLYNHECVIVSGLGAFIIYEEEAVIDEKRGYFTPNKKAPNAYLKLIASFFRRTIQLA